MIYQSKEIIQEKPCRGEILKRNLQLHLGKGIKKRQPNSPGQKRKNKDLREKKQTRNLTVCSSSAIQEDQHICKINKNKITITTT